MAPRLRKRWQKAFALVLSACLLAPAMTFGGAALAAESADEELELKRGDLSDHSSEDDRGDASSKDSFKPSVETAGTTGRGATSVNSDSGGNSFKGDGNDENIHKPFNLNVQTSVMDGSADNNNFQGGANNNLFRGGVNAPGGLGSQSPQLGGNINRPVLKPGTNITSLNGGLTEVQLQRLAAHDLVLIIDQSASMYSRDCPVSGLGRVGGTVMGMLLGSAGMVSRWEWCRDQTLNLAQQTRNIANKDLTVILFSGEHQVFQHVTVDQIPNIFKQASPQGSTNLTEPLRATVNDYFARQTATRGDVKPLAIAIITDGLPNSRENVCKVLVDTTRLMRDPRDIKITFFMIGNSALTGQSFINEIEHNLPKYGGRFNIVKSVSFWNLMKIGLSKALADALE